MSKVENHPELLLRLHKPFANPSTLSRLHVLLSPTHFTQQPLSLTLLPSFCYLYGSKKSISKGGIIPNLQPLLSPHLREPFANLSPGYQESLDDMLCTENLFRQPFRNKIHSSQKSEPFSKPFAELFPTAVFLSQRFIILSPTYIIFFIEVYDVAHKINWSERSFVRS